MSLTESAPAASSTPVPAGDGPHQQHRATEHRPQSQPGLDPDIRQSTDVRRAAGDIAAGGLAGAAAVHLLWAAGSSWPAKDYDDLANLVVGRGPFPSRPLTAVAAGLLMTASTIAVAANRPAPAQSWVVRIGPKIVAASLLVRGVGGLAVSALGVGQASEQFRQWDLRLYSPLCIALGACVAIGGPR